MCYTVVRLAPQTHSLFSDRDALKLMTAVANGHPSFYKFSIPPRRVLDLGCGEGSWILQTSELWKVLHHCTCTNAIYILSYSSLAHELRRLRYGPNPTYCL